METPINPLLQQIHIGLGPNGYEPVASSMTANSTTYIREFEQLTANLVRICPGHIWPGESYKSICPRPILINQGHQAHLMRLHEALTKAITDIVQRWWSDTEANFPSRMPLAKEEEDLLLWIEDQVSQGRMRPFSACRGSWRPDFLIKDNLTATPNGIINDQAGESELFCITEINARFSFNGCLHEALGQEALNDMGMDKLGLASATNSAQMLDGLMSLFRPGLPLHLLRDAEHGFDIHMFMDIMQRRFGVTTRPITPADLRLVPDPENETGFKLCCLASHKNGSNQDTGSHPAQVGSTVHQAGKKTVTWINDAGEWVEEIHQVGLELHQREIVALDAEMLRQVSLRCFNDMRTVLLVHDKRMLGMVKQELENLVNRGVLTLAEAQVLAKGIADTANPGSPEMGEVLKLTKANPELRKQYLLKPVRSGKGAGIVFGDETSPDEWVAALENLQSPVLVPGVSCVVQRRITPRLYDVIIKSSGDRVRYPLVGTYHAIHGNLLGLGIWRTSADRICALSTGGSWMCSVISRG